MIIDSRKLYAYFDNNYSLQKTSSGWFAFKCPICNELENRKKGAVHIQYQVVKCWICGYKDFIDRFVADTEGLTLTEARQLLHGTEPSAFQIEKEFVVDNIVNQSTLELPEGYHSITEGKHAFGKRARKYLTDRGFSLDELDRMGIGYCYHEKENLPENENYFGYIIIPFKVKGKLVYYIGRDFVGNFLRYKNPSKEMTGGIGKGDLLFNEDALNIYDEVFITEGWADASTLGRAGISTQGWSLSKRQKHSIHTSNCKRLVFVPDAGYDNTGVSFYVKALQVAQEFMDEKEVKVLNLQKLSSDGKDANALGKQKVLELYSQTPVLDYGSLMQEILNND